MTTTKPVTPLPWLDFPNSDKRTGHLIIGGTRLPEALREPAICKRAGGGKPDDMEYIVHACNAYPRLVEMLRNIAANEWDSNGATPTGKSVSALLHELGEMQ